MSEPADLEDPVARARRMNEFFGPLVPGRMGCVFDHAGRDLVLGHIDVTETLALLRCTQMVLLPR